MTKYIKIIFAACIVLAAATTSCKKDDKVKEFTVTFNSNSGSEVPKQTVKDGEKATKPADPEKEGNTFDGWFKDNNTFAQEWNFAADAVTANITLYAKWNAMPSAPVILADFFTLEDATNNVRQQGWKVNGIMSEIAAAKYLVLETKGAGDGYSDGFGGIQFIFQGNDGDPATLEVGWTQRNLNGDWVTFPRAEGKTVSIVIDINKVLGDKYDDFLQCTFWARILIAYYAGYLPTAFENLGLTGAYLIDDFEKPADAVDLASGYGFIIEGTVF